MHKAGFASVHCWRSSTTGSGYGELTAGLLRQSSWIEYGRRPHRAGQEFFAGLRGGKPRSGKSVLVHTDTAGGTHNFLNFLVERRLSYAVGLLLSTAMPVLYPSSPKPGVWEPGSDTDGGPRDGADVAELTGALLWTIGRHGSCACTSTPCRPRSREQPAEPWCL